MKPSCLLLSSVLFLAACTATGQPYQASKAPSGKAQIVVYRTSAGEAPVNVNGTTNCDLPKNGYFVVTVPANQPVHLSSKTNPFLSGNDKTSTYAVTPKAGAVHYVRVDTNQKAKIAGAVGMGMLGILGSMGASSAVSDEGLFIFREGNADEAASTREACK